MTQLPQPLLCIAHRGGKNQYTENTLAGLNHCLSLAVDAIEIDVWPIGDELLVTHDRRLGITLPGQGRLEDFSAEQLLALRLQCGSKLARLGEVLALVGGRVQLNIEMKGSDCAQPLAAALRQHCGDCGYSFDQFIVSGFNQPQLFEFKQRLPQVRRGVLVAGIPLDYAAAGEELEAYSFHPNINCLNQALVSDAKRRGLQVWAYTVNDVDDMQSLASMGVDGVFTDFPEILIELNAASV